MTRPRRGSGDPSAHSDTTTTTGRWGLWACRLHATAYWVSHASEHQNLENLLPIAGKVAIARVSFGSILTSTKRGDERLRGERSLPNNVCISHRRMGLLVIAKQWVLYLPALHLISVYGSRPAWPQAMPVLQGGNISDPMRSRSLVHLRDRTRGQFISGLEVNYMSCLYRSGRSTQLTCLFPRAVMHCQTPPHLTWATPTIVLI